MDAIRRYYPTLTEQQMSRFEALEALYAEWNARINVISRKDIENLYVHHVLHSLGIEKMLRFSANSSVMDVGTGGGFPGIPLAILFPEVRFHLIDGTGKKIKVVQAVADALALDNLTASHRRIEDERGKYDFIVSRAVMPLPDLAKLVRKNIGNEQHNALPNGLICLKGGNVQGEIAPFGKRCSYISLSDYFTEEYFKEKKVIYLQL
ncbi:MAG: 16S rRNA (guanine(527)-N(7))-methyltransferase RsmG [Tannerella sp.]|jgi:16S rRNA (guanine527-N7)-methyltransferase|nr:16S rRNA (guanine(527)-N(7))-methyltransferase RsmG [Tannerella sp.]